MIGAVIDRIDSDGVHAELLEVWDITLAYGRVGERVDNLRATTGLVVDAAQVKSGGTRPECCTKLVSLVKCRTSRGSMHTIAFGCDHRQRAR
jgi:hypothetical protein